jgi:hypothetical protein
LPLQLGIPTAKSLFGGDAICSSCVDHASLTDNIVDQANTKLDLARVLTALERPEAATRRHAPRSNCS